MGKRCVTYTFENPNRDGVFVRVLREVLIEKLAAQRREGPFEDCSLLPCIHG